MTPADAAELLSIAAAFDRRKIGHTDALAWAKALEGLNPRDCAQAITDHFKDSTEYLMPAHVRQRVQRLRTERIRAVPSTALEPADVDPNDVEAYQVARLALIRRVADGDPLPERPALPARDPEKLLAGTAASMRRAALQPSPGYVAASRKLAAAVRSKPESGSGAAS